ncbi:MULTISPECIES: hypothetical protein [Vibrio]|uniref:hypothetical protein n=1 Tax=Vibrio TaxID=662 RepID=UPI00142F10CD|nr:MULTISPECIES: hypothetical protein [Vibrio]
MKVMLVLAVVIQIVVAIQSEGLARSLAELTAFLLVAALVVHHKQAAKPIAEAATKS